MAITTYSTDLLDSNYYSLLNSIMTQERAPVERLSKQKDSITLQKAVYTDLKTKMDSLQSSIQALRQSSAFNAISAGRKAAVSPPSGFTVFSATAGSAALTGNYSIAVNQLARGERARSEQMSSADQALGISGTFIMGGAQTRSATATSTSGAVSSFGTAALASGQQELGSDDYFVEVRHDNTSGWQFRMVDGEGKAASIKDGTAYDSNWQSITQNSTFDTGRGMTISFGDSSGFIPNNWKDGAAKVDYKAQGAQITLDGTESLTKIADKINTATYGAGNEVSASVIDRRMVLQTANTGSNRHIRAEDMVRGVADTDPLAEGDTADDSVLRQLGVLTSGGALRNYTAETDSSRNVSLTVNTDISVSRRSNTGLTDVITGVSIDLASDAEGRTASLAVIADMSAAKYAVGNFVTKFNELQTYLKAKIATTKNEDGTYTRGSLAGEMMYRSMSYNLTSYFGADASNNGTFTNLRQIGLELSSEAKIVDNTLLNNVLSNDMGNVADLLESVMTKMENEVSMYTGSKGVLQSSMENVDDQVKNYGDRISQLKTRLDVRQQTLIKQFLDAQTALSMIQTDMSTLNAGNSAFMNFNYSA